MLHLRCLIGFWIRTGIQCITRWSFDSNKFWLLILNSFEFISISQLPSRIIQSIRDIKFALLKNWLQIRNYFPCTLFLYWTPGTAKMTRCIYFSAWNFLYWFNFFYQSAYQRTVHCRNLITSSINPSQAFLENRSYQFSFHSPRLSLLLSNPFFSSFHVACSLIISQESFNRY